MSLRVRRTALSRAVALLAAFVAAPLLCGFGSDGALGMSFGGVIFGGEREAGFAFAAFDEPVDDVNEFRRFFGGACGGKSRSLRLLSSSVPSPHRSRRSCAAPSSRRAPPCRAGTRALLLERLHRGARDLLLAARAAWAARPLIAVRAQVERARVERLFPRPLGRGLSQGVAIAAGERAAALAVERGRSVERVERAGAGAGVAGVALLARPVVPGSARTKKRESRSAREPSGRLGRFIFFFVMVATYARFGSAASADAAMASKFMSLSPPIVFTGRSMETAFLILGFDGSPSLFSDERSAG